MAAEAVRFAAVDARPTAVVAQTTTWQEFPELWGLSLLLAKLPSPSPARTELLVIKAL